MTWRVGQEDGYYDAREPQCEWDLSLVWEARQYLKAHGTDVDGATPQDVVDVMDAEYPGGFDGFWANESSAKRAADMLQSFIDAARVA